MISHSGHQRLSFCDRSQGSQLDFVTGHSSHRQSQETFQHTRHFVTSHGGHSGPGITVVTGYFNYQMRTLHAVTGHGHHGNLFQHRHFVTGHSSHSGHETLQ